MLIRFITLIAALSLSVPQARAETISVIVDTSSHAGETGGIYFQFAPGLNADPASVAITGFLIGSPGALLPGEPLNFSTGGASGSLDAGDLMITNDFATNDYGESLIFGNFISFLVTLNLPAVLTGDSGSELFLQLTAADLLTPLLTSDPDGKLVILSYNQAGALNVVSTSPSASVNQVEGVPEPSTVSMFAAALGVAVWSRFRRSWASRR